MYLFTRRTRLIAGDTRGALAWATDLTEKVNQISGLRVTLNTPVFSEGIGTLVWATYAEDLSQLEAANDKLQVDEGFQDAADAGAKFTNGLIDDTLLQVIHGAPDPARQVSHAAVVAAVGVAGKLSRAVELGVEIAQKGEKITGIPSIFGVASTGPYGGVAWLSTFESIDQLQQAQDALAGDASWLSFLDKELPGVYLEDPNITQQTIYRRVG